MTKACYALGPKYETVTFLTPGPCYTLQNLYRHDMLTMGKVNIDGKSPYQILVDFTVISNVSLPKVDYHSFSSHKLGIHRRPLPDKCKVTKKHLQTGGVANLSMCPTSPHNQQFSGTILELTVVVKSSGQIPRHRFTPQPKSSVKL
jgi:hypothetical protein